MNPQEILNSQYTAPDMPDVSQVSEAMRTVREHVAKNKGPYALLAASLPIVGYGAHRMMRRTPEADPEPSTHTQQAAVEMPQIQQGSDKIAEAVLARFGLKEANFTGALGVMKNFGRMGAVAGGAIGGGTSLLRQSRGDQPIDWQRTAKSTLVGAGVGAGLGAAGGAGLTYGINRSAQQGVAQAQQALQHFNTQRDAIMAKYHAGQMSVEDAHAAMSALHH